MASAGKAIGLFGGTFDPVHEGHVAITRSFLDSGFIDELWVVLTPDPPHKNERELSPYALREEMLKVAFKDMDRVVVTDVEKRLPKPSYTIQTIRYLTGQFSRHTFYLCMGGDSLAGFEDWFKWEEILKYCELLVASRPKTNPEHLNKKITDRAHFIKHKPVEVSSTELRSKLARGETAGLPIPEEVYEFILAYNLYRDDTGEETGSMGV